jgi:hypothetical protein
MRLRCIKNFSSYLEKRVEKLDNEDKAAGEGGEGEDEQNKADGEVRHPVQVQ